MCAHQRVAHQAHRSPGWLTKEGCTFESGKGGHLPEAHTFGETKEEALARAEDALARVIQAYIADRRPIPKPSAPKKKDVSFTLPVSKSYARASTVSR
jgi:hypothetical protein